MLPGFSIPLVFVLAFPSGFGVELVGVVDDGEVDFTRHVI